MKVRPPATYQGGKQRLADEIVGICLATRSKIDAPPDFADLCCGSGAIAIAARSAGVPAASVMMVDSGPWGSVWAKVAEGKFSLEALSRIAARVPKEPERQADFLRELLQQSTQIDHAETFLILQAGSFGGKPVHDEGGKWRGHPRDFWRSSKDPKKWTGTMMPCADEVVRRMEALCELLLGIAAWRGDFLTIENESGILYVDPPYEGTTGYGGGKTAISFPAFAARNPRADVWVSEARAIGPHAKMLSAGRAMGGMSGKRKRPPHEEWLSRVEPAKE
jgi:site-specific DNA-adenine methylase